MSEKVTGIVILLLAVAGLTYLSSHAPELIQPAAPRPQEQAVPRYNVEDRPVSYIAPSAQQPSGPQVEIGYVSIRDYPSSFSFITLYSRTSGGERVNVTGWRIKSNRGEFTIPRAVEVYEPSGTTPEGDILLGSGQTLYVYSNTNPIRKNLRLNKCIGFLEEFYDFEPDLPRSCPSIPRSEYRSLSGQCQSYILSLGSCRLPDVNFYNALPGTADGNACRNFLSTINYNSCFQKYRYDSDFYSNEWRVWINQQIFDSRHDFVQLIDRQGNVVDTYEY